MLRGIYQGLKGAALFLPAYLVITDSIVDIAFVSGSSMQPTLNLDAHQDVVLITRYDISPPSLSKGDIVSMRSPDDPEKSLVKRVIALEGDTVKPRPNSKSRGQLIKIPKGHCWVEGDNWVSSRDSNTFGPVPLALIHGRVKRIIWPSGRSGKISSESPTHRTPDSFGTEENHPRQSIYQEYELKQARAKELEDAEREREASAKTTAKWKE